ncbi:conserved hypothetical protein [Leishmania major strain Friedlin]|uniref:Uncharacterized protein n=1 Tax=Leishmania major TaxID=5664 RepID=Q4Q444_LEIMA|nr:conserved hypothetical protein [Leishmania major strain Friedlin]CAG9580723.1 hypothetical_protein_-_conserved [Leishmania major strain Friedlin]CAJ06360.1 conserved hypothetical protein [Leishmania major strain Friedlin]|eukprot:XP_001685904.1 conserved hypothetical protein [Leishmania major strain Friedlin]
MWRPRRVQGLGSGEDICHLVSAVRRQGIRSLPSGLVVAAEIAYRCCSYSIESFQTDSTEAKKPSRVVGTAPTERQKRPSALAPSSSIPATEKAGIIVEWVPDALGYHLPLGLRERWEPSSKASPTEAGGLKASNDAETHGTEQQELEEVSSVGNPCASSRVGDGGGGSGHRSGHSDGPPFYGPLPNFATSPVFEWERCLWQWRPVKITPAAGTPHHTSLTVTAPISSSGEKRPLRDEMHCSDGGENDLAEGGLGESSQVYHLVPFLLCPTLEVCATQPLMHGSLRKELAAAQNACHHLRRSWPEDAKQDLLGTRRCPTYSEHETRLWSITIPTPVGELALSSPQDTDGDDANKQNTMLDLPTFAMIEGEPPMRVGGRIRACCGHGITSPAPPEAETWEAATAAARNERSTSAGNAAVPYVHVFCSEMSAACSDSLLSQTGIKASELPTPSSCDVSSPTLPLTRRNVVGGGLAELILAVDRYAALIARGDLALSAACWATLCDTKSWWVVQRLRVCPLEMERELVAATEAHKLWQQYAVSRNSTLVGKSSHGICFYDYPFLAKWPLGRQAATKATAPIRAHTRWRV